MSNGRLEYEANRGWPSATTAIERRLEVSAAVNGEPDLSLRVQRAVNIGRETARVLFSAGGPISEPNVRASIAHMFGNHARYLEGSATHVPEQPNLLMAFVGLNKPSVPFEGASAALPGLRSHTPNVFTDAQDRVWRAVGEGASKMLMQETDDDLAALLEARNSVSIVTASIDVAMGETYGPGDGLVWYDAAKETYRVGLAVASDTVFDFDDHKAFAAVPRESVVLAMYAGDEVAASMLMPANGGAPLDRDNMVQRQLDYNAMLYGRNSAWFEKFKGLLQMHTRKMSLTGMAPAGLTAPVVTAPAGGV